MCRVSNDQLVGVTILGLVATPFVAIPTGYALNYAGWRRLGGTLVFGGFTVTAFLMLCCGPRRPSSFTMGYHMGYDAGRHNPSNATCLARRLNRSSLPMPDREPLDIPK